VTRALAATVAAAGLLVALVATMGVPRPGISVLWLSLAVLGLDLMAVVQRPFGLFSASFVCTFAMGLTPEIGPALAGVVALLAIVLRTLVKGAHGWQARWREALSDAVPTLAALAVIRVYGDSPLIEGSAVLLFVSLTSLLNRWLVEELPGLDESELIALRWVSWSMYLGLGFLGICLAELLRVHPQAGLWLLPVLLVFQRAAQVEAGRLELLDTQRQEANVERARLELALTQVKLREAEGDLYWKAEEGQLLERFSRSLAKSANLDGVLEAIYAQVPRAVHARSLVILLVERGNLVLKRAWGPHAQSWLLVDPARLQSYLRIVEPTPARLLQEEVTGMLAPMESEGLIYVGRDGEEPFSEREKAMLAMLAGQAALGIQSARRFESQQDSVTQLAGANLELREALAQLLTLLEGSRAMAATLDREALADRFRQLLESLVPHRGGALLTSGQVRLAWGEPITGAPANPVEPMVSGGLLAMPLADEEGTFGAIWLAGEGFTAGQVQALTIASYHLATALRGAAAQQKLQEAQAQVVQTTKMAAVGELAAGVAHEINSPLGAITVALQSVEANLDDPEAARRRLGIAQRAADKARRIIEKLLYYSREGGAGLRSVDLVQVAEDTLEIFATQIERDGAQIVRKFTPVPPVRGNPHELQQVLVNLLLNARDAVKDQPSKTITVSTSAEPHKVKLEVSDSGPGVPAEIRERIFEPFFTTKAVGVGTGLGLSVSHQLVAQHKGTLSIVSRPGEGARFCVALPPGE